MLRASDLCGECRGCGEMRDSDVGVPYFGVDPEKSSYVLGIRSYDRNPKPKRVLKYSAPKPSFKGSGFRGRVRVG